jgi:hypothetical protein
MYMDESRASILFSVLLESEEEESLLIQHAIALVGAH